MAGNGILSDRLKKVDRLFFWIVLLPTALAAIYYFVLASDIYISESRFVVRSPDKPTQTPIGLLLKGVGFSNAGDEIFAVRDFITSRDAMTKVNSDHLLERAFGNPGASIVDRYNPFGGPVNQEKLYKFYQKNVSVEYDSSSSILRMDVHGFEPKDALAINARLLDISEALVNRLNERGRTDLIKFARAEVVEAKQQAQSSANALAAFRNREGVVDPEKQAAIQLQMISKLQDELVATRTQLRQLQAFTPLNPQVPALQLRVKGLQHEIDQASGLVAGGRKSLAGSTARYQRLLLDSQIADRQLATAMGSLSDAFNEGRRKQAYVERIVPPNLPDYPLEPRRVRGVLSILALGIVIWLVARMLLAGVREHND